MPAPLPPRTIPQSMTGGLRPGVRPPPGPLAPPPPGPEGGVTPPLGGPASTPAPMRGLAANARVQVIQAMDMLVQALPSLGILSDEGKAVSDVLTKLQRAFGKVEDKSRDLIPQETMNLLAATPKWMRGAVAGAGAPGGGGPPAAAPGGAGRPPTPPPPMPPMGAPPRLQ